MIIKKKKENPFRKILNLPKIYQISEYLIQIIYKAQKEKILKSRLLVQEIYLTFINLYMIEILYVFYETLNIQIIEFVHQKFKQINLTTH